MSLVLLLFPVYVIVAISPEDKARRRSPSSSPEMPARLEDHKTRDVELQSLGSKLLEWRQERSSTNRQRWVEVENQGKAEVGTNYPI